MNSLNQFYTRCTIPYAHSFSQKRFNYTQDILAGNNVWIGVKSTILKGVKLSDGPVVSTAGIVTKKLEGNRIIAGNPAKAIKQNIQWSREQLS